MSDSHAVNPVSEHAEFTESEYAAFLDLAASKYRFCDYDSGGSDPFVVWRHDVDHSPHRALALARIEGQRKLRCVYHVLLSSRYYNVLEPEISAVFREIAGLGHEIGLHVDMDVFGEDRSPPVEDIEREIRFEKNVLETIVGVKMRSMSFHNYTLNGDRLRHHAIVEGMTNASTPAFFKEFTYVSDSNGIWRYQRLRDVLAAPAVPKLHVLTHPEWWTPEPMPPLERMRRLVDGRAAANFNLYAYQMQRDGRLATIGERLGFTAEEIARTKLPPTKPSKP